MEAVEAVEAVETVVGEEAWRRGGVEARRRGCVCRCGGVEAWRHV